MQKLQIGNVRLVLPPLRLGLFAGLLLACLPVTAPGHAKLVRSQPKAKQTVLTPPKLIELWFSEELEPRLNTIEIKASSGSRVDRGEVVLADGNKKAQVELGELTPGVYTVEWKALSVDQHPMRGKFTFTVAAPIQQPGTGAQSPAVTSPGTPPTQGQLETSDTEDSADRIFLGQTVARWLSYLAMMLVFGGFAFRSLVLAPALRNVNDHDQRIKAAIAGKRCIVKVLWLGAITLALTSILALVLQASDVYDKSFFQALSPSVLAKVLATGYGPSWLLQAGSVAAITVILLLISRPLGRQPEAEHSALWWAGLVVGAAMLLAPSWTGHAMVSVKHFRLALLSDWLHLLAGGFWVGGLFHLATTWPAVLPTIPKHSRPAALHYLIRSFTRTAMPSVVLLVLAGLYNTWAHVPGIGALWLTPYGQALSVKLLLVLFMLLLGAINNYHFGRRAARLQRKGKGAPATGQLERGFYRSVVLEASLGVIVLLVTAVLVFLTPARNHPAMETLASGEALIRQR